MTERSKYTLTHTLRQNAYFFIPFASWILIGGGLLLTFSRSELFFAVNTNFNPFLDKLNTVLSAFGRGDVIPFILLSLLLIPGYRNLNYIATTLSFGIIIPLVIYAAKQFFNTPRPLKYYGVLQVHTVPWLDNLYETSFPSGHTLGAEAHVAIFLFVGTCLRIFTLVSRATFFC
jgi:membrane-associated phospholipid phosphatase